jgi:hypothetical protein
MAAEIAVLVSTAKAVTELLEKAKPLVGQIRSGFRAQNDSVQQDLAKKFEELEASIHAVGDLAYVGEEYGRMHEEVRGLLWDCERARSFLVENREECTKRSNAGYEPCWRILDTIFDSLGNRRNPVIRIQSDRARWYDDKDKAELSQRLNDFGAMQIKASESVRIRAALEAQQRLETMIGYLNEVSTKLDDTMYNQIFRNLQTLGH